MAGACAWRMLARVLLLCFSFFSMGVCDWCSVEWLLLYESERVQNKVMVTSSERMQAGPAFFYFLARQRQDPGFLNCITGEKRLHFFLT